MTKHTPYLLQFDLIPALNKEIEALKNTVKTQQEAVDASVKVIDELRMENRLLKANLYLRAQNNELAKYKNLLHESNDNYQRLSERFELLMSKYIRQ